MRHKVYMYTFPNGMRYIGVTSLTLEQRRDNGYQHNKELRKAMRRYGWANIEKTILCECETKEQAFEEEKRMIAEYGTTDPSKGYNVSYGGKSTFEGLKHTEEHKAYMSRVLKGISFTDDHIENLKKGHAKERKPVESISEDGTVKKYGSLGEAALDVNGFKSNISRACKRAIPYKGFMWRYAEGGEF